jgi:hypothetical protein
MARQTRSFAPARTFGRSRSFASPYRARATPASAAPLPGTIVDAVLRYHDEVVDQGGGRSLLRLSRDRLGEAEVAQALGDHARRAAEVSILWNEREGEIIRVLEGAARRMAA